MAFLFRCPECRTRRRSHGLFTQHLRETGHRLCRCGASRHGASDEEVIEIALEIVLTTRGRPAQRCPF